MSGYLARTERRPRLVRCAGCGYSYWSHDALQDPDGPHCVDWSFPASEYRSHPWLYDEEAIDWLASGPESVTPPDQAESDAQN